LIDAETVSNSIVLYLFSSYRNDGACHARVFIAAIPATASGSVEKLLNL